jgi:vancomycin resistance protein YoaR
VFVATCAGTAVFSYSQRGAVFLLLQPPRDLALAGLAAPSHGSVTTWLTRFPRERCFGDKFLFTGEEYLPVSALQLGFDLDTERTLRRIELQEPQSTWLGRVRRAFFPEPTRQELTPAYDFDVSIAEQTLTRLAARLDRAPENAVLDMKRHLRVADKPGRRLDIAATVQRLLDSLDTDSVELVFETVPARVTLAQLAPVDVSLVLSSFETDFRKKAGRRAINIRRAVELLNGTIIAPGETLSFNQVVGDRTEGNGFTWAPVIVNDEMEPGLGGGVCQVASTLHASAVLGGLNVKERRSHSRPSDYTPLGLDAAVIYGEVDLKLENPYPVPLLVHAFLPSPFVVRVEVLGASKDVAIEHEYAVLGKHDFYRRLVESPELPAGTFERTQKGSFGYDIVSVVRTTHRDGSAETRRYPSKYYPVPEVYSVGPGTSPDALPALPEGATSVEIAGLTDGVSSDEAPTN